MGGASRGSDVQTAPAAQFEVAVITFPLFSGHLSNHNYPHGTGPAFEPALSISMDVSDFHFDLPSRLIAQEPAGERGTSRLLVLHRRSGQIEHASVSRVGDFLRAGDLVVVNDTKVFPARLLGVRDPSGGSVECLLLGRREGNCWDALVHPGQKLQPGARMIFRGASRTLHGEILDRQFHGRRTIRLWSDAGEDIDDAIDEIGHVPLPPYIKRQDQPQDRERYQTVYARERGSIAAPTAGLHFTPPILDALAGKGIERVAITLHVGYGTFQPVRVAQVEGHTVDREYFSISETAALLINRAKQDGRRIVAVGTTTTRALEAAAHEGHGIITPHAGWTDLFIYPGFEFRTVTALLTNFHLPMSSLLMLVAAFAGRDRVLAAYREAVQLGYRFYSYGDAMLIL
jgi:S-adenosylmethionine:tRNA ribosyltransferase-isomerase